MKKSIKLLLVFISLWTANSFGQGVIHFVDIPKVDGEFTIPATRKTTTKSPKRKSTLLSDFDFQLAKTIYVNPQKNVETQFKPTGFLPITIKMPFDKSYKEWQERLLNGRLLTSLDIFTDYRTISSTSEIQHIRLINIKVQELKFDLGGDLIQKVTLEYEKIIYSYSSLNPDDSIKATNQLCFDLKNGVPCSETL